MKKILKYSVFVWILLLGFTFYYNILYTMTAFATTTPKKEPTSLQEVQSLSIDELVQFERYDGRKLGTVTEVLDQGNLAICWSYATISSIQSNLLRKGIVKNPSDFPPMYEKNLAYARYNRTKGDPLGNTDETIFTTNEAIWLGDGGFPEETASVFAQGRGISPDKTQSDDFDNCFDFLGSVYIENSVEKIKRAVAQYGGLAFTYKGQPTDEKYVYNTSAKLDHACEIVGWDDSIPASKFKSNSMPQTQPKQNGAWICKNSWGTTYEDEYDGTKPVGDYGYFYLSYDSKMGEIVAFDFADPTEYDNIYFYDAQVSKMSDSQKLNAYYTGNGASVKAANLFEAKKSLINTKELIKSANVAVGGNDITCTVKVYTGLNSLTSNPESGTLRASKTVNIATTGFYTITFDTLIEINPHEIFSVVVEVSNKDKTAAILCDMDYASTYDFSQCWDASQSIWKDTKKANLYTTARIKAFTVNQTRDNPLTNDISYATVSNLPVSVDYNEKAQEPNFIVKMDFVSLELNKDYTVSYTNNRTVGIATVTMQGIGSYTGSLNKTFIIQKAAMPPNLPGEKEDVFGSTRRYMEIDYPIQKISDIALPNGWKWLFPDSKVVTGRNSSTIDYVDPTGYIGGYERTMFDIIVMQKAENNGGNVDSGNGGNSGNVTPTTIDINNCSVQVIGQYTYTGKAIMPEVVVHYQGRELAKNVDYVCQYYNNIDATTNAYVTVTGRSNYSGRITKYFTILQAERPITENIQLIIPKDAKYLRDIALPKDWQWKEPDRLLSSLTVSRQIVKATIVYVGADKANYKTTELVIDLDLKANTAVIPSYQTPNSTTQKKNALQSILIWTIVGGVLFLLLAIGITVFVVLLQKRKVVKNKYKK